MVLDDECMPENAEVDASYVGLDSSSFVGGDVSLCESDGVGIKAYRSSETVEASVDAEFVLVGDEPGTDDPSTSGCTFVCDVDDDMAEIDEWLDGLHVANDETMPLTGEDIVEFDAMLDGVLDAGYVENEHGNIVGDLRPDDDSLAIVDDVMPLVDEFMVKDAPFETLWLPQPYGYDDEHDV